VVVKSPIFDFTEYFPSEISVISVAAKFHFGPSLASSIMSYTLFTGALISTLLSTLGIINHLI